ncbi:MAG: dihydrofolate reductase family protein [Fervidobacterium sp.]|uniref:dihydrofolate reductase family protein n=1 Tax=Fervidobacterium sp. TaxID=1871331 RepID=UPI004048ECDA
MCIRLIAVTDIRGMIAIDENDRTEWGSLEDKKLFKEITISSGVVIMGRRTFESIGKKLPGRLNVVLSRSGIFKNEMPDIVLSGEPREILESLRERGYQDMCVIGGQQVFTQFIDSGTVTDIYLTIEPIILPDGINLFEKIGRIYNLKLENVRLLNESGSIHIHYVVK